MKIRVAALLMLGGLIAVPARAEDRSMAGGLPALAGQVADLIARVSKLEGNLTAADLVGTYNFNQLQTGLAALIPSTIPNTPPTRNALIDIVGSTGTVTVHANGTGTYSAMDTEGRLIQGPWTLEQGVEPDAGTFTWSYANGIVTLIPDDGPAIKFAVGPGGRLLVGLLQQSNTTEKGTSVGLLILTRQ